MNNVTRTIQKNKFFTIERIWFTNQGHSKCDIIRYTRAEKPINKGLFVIIDENETVISNLNYSDEDILKRCSKTVKYEIKKCLNEKNEISNWDAKDLLGDKHIVEEFEKLYVELSKCTNNTELLKAYSRKKINNLIDNNCILITRIKFESITIYHIYAWGYNDAVLLFSVSNFRVEKDSKYQAGQLNKLLHYKDMLYFRDVGVKSYDWGNIFSSTNPNGIDKFKMSFGGTIEKRYNIFLGNSIIGKCLVLAKKLIRVC